LNGELFEVCWWDGQKLNGKRDTKGKNEGNDGGKNRQQVRRMEGMTSKEDERDKEKGKETRR
jgi:hypothetical protein